MENNTQQIYLEFMWCVADILLLRDRLSGTIHSMKLNFQTKKNSSSINASTTKRLELHGKHSVIMPLKISKIFILNKC